MGTEVGMGTAADELPPFLNDAPDQEEIPIKEEALEMLNLTDPPAEGELDPPVPNGVKDPTPSPDDATPKEDDEEGKDEEGKANHNKYCHFCQHIKLKASAMLACETKGCARRFCEHCLTNQLGDSVERGTSSAWEGGSWSCPVCRRLCCCALQDCTKSHRHCKAYRYRRRRAEQAAKKGGGGMAAAMKTGMVGMGLGMESYGGRGMGLGLHGLGGYSEAVSEALMRAAGAHEVGGQRGAMMGGPDLELNDQQRYLSHHSLYGAYPMPMQHRGFYHPQQGMPFAPPHMPMQHPGPPYARHMPDRPHGAMPGGDAGSRGRHVGGYAEHGAEGMVNGYGRGGRGELERQASGAAGLAGRFSALGQGDLGLSARHPHPSAPPPDPASHAPPRRYDLAAMEADRPMRPAPPNPSPPNPSPPNPSSAAAVATSGSASGGGSGEGGGGGQKRLNRTDSHEYLNWAATGRAAATPMGVSKGRRWGGSTENLRRLTSGLSPCSSQSDLQGMDRQARGAQREASLAQYAAQTLMARSGSSSSINATSMQQLQHLPPEDRRDRSDSIPEEMGVGGGLLGEEGLAEAGDFMDTPPPALTELGSSKGMRHSESMNSLSGGIIDLGGLLRNNSRDDLLGSSLGGDDGLMGLTRTGSNDSLNSLADHGLGDLQGGWPQGIKSEW